MFAGVAETEHSRLPRRPTLCRPANTSLSQIKFYGCAYKHLTYSTLLTLLTTLFFRQTCGFGEYMCLLLPVPRARQLFWTRRTSGCIAQRSTILTRSGAAVRMAIQDGTVAQSSVQVAIRYKPTRPFICIIMQ